MTEFHPAVLNTAQPALFWDGRPAGRRGRIIAHCSTDLPASVLEDMASAATRVGFLRVLAKLRRGAYLNRRQVYLRVDAGPRALHFAFFNGRVQVSYGHAGFVPLYRLLSYTRDELLTYVSEPNRIAPFAFGSWRATHRGSMMIH